MKAIVFKRGRLSLADVPKPERGRGEALIRVVLAGICNTDIEITKGYMGFEGIPGHEFVGIVEAADNEDLVGRRVVGEINIGCDKCEICKTGDPRHCAGRSVLGIVGKDGAFAEYLTLPEKNLFVIPDKITDKTAVLIEPLAAALQITSQIDHFSEMKVLVIGDGKLGLLIAEVLKAEGAEVYLSGHHTKRNRSLVPSVEHLEQEHATEKKASFDIVVESSGNKDGLDMAVRYVKPKGKVVLKSTYADDAKLDAATVVVNEITLIGSRCGRFDIAIDALASGGVQIPCGYVESIYPMTRFEEAFKQTCEPGTLKVLLRPDF